jgi:hypothetical protein
MRQEAAAERAKAGYVDKLPDPTVGTMIFGEPMNFVPDKQLAELQLSQMIPWLGQIMSTGRLKARISLIFLVTCGLKGVRILA